VALAFVLITAGVIAYAGSLSAPFIFDDNGAVFNNPNIQHLWPLHKALSARAQAPVAGRPVACLSLAINYALGGYNVWGYHAFNLATHLLCGLLLMGVVRRTLLAPIFGGRFERTATWLAGAAALIWTLHPLLTDAVTYVTQRTELLMGLFYLLTLYCCIRGWSAPALTRRRGWFAMAIVACGLGMASKEVMVSAPLMALLYDRTFVARSFASAWRQRWRLYLGLGATWVVLVALMASDARGKSIGFDHGISTLDYLRTQAGVIVWYLRLAFWPDPLLVSYEWPVVRTFAEIWPYGIAIVALLGVTIWALWRRSWLGFLGAWFFMILAPTSSFVPIVTEIAAERRMYLPLAAIVVGVIITGHRALTLMFSRMSARLAVAQCTISVLFVALAALLGYATVDRNRDYRTRVAMWRDVVDKQPHNPTGHSGLAVALSDLGRWDDAFDHFAEAVRLKPGAEYHYNLGKAFDRRDEHEKAIEHFNEALRNWPDYPEAHNSLGNSLVKLGRDDEAFEHYAVALQIKPEMPSANANIAHIYVRRGQFAKAAEHYAVVVRLQPDDAEARYNLGLALYKTGRNDEAIQEFRKVIKLKPDLAQVWYQLGNALLLAGKVEESARAYRKALELKPDYVSARRALDYLQESQARPTTP